MQPKPTDWGHAAWDQTFHRSDATGGESPVNAAKKTQDQSAVAASQGKTLLLPSGFVHPRMSKPMIGVTPAYPNKLAQESLTWCSSTARIYSIPPGS